MTGRTPAQQAVLDAFVARWGDCYTGAPLSNGTVEVRQNGFGVGFILPDGTTTPSDMVEVGP